MTALPIATRELRVAARKRATYWVRTSAALIAFLIGVGAMALSLLSGGGTVGIGHGLFGLLTGLSLAAALAAGLFLTADCLSEEKREGTLGLLFLTDLRGHDVVFGKLMATSLRSVHGLLALFPILAITLLMGGVTGAQFWKTTLALANTLFFSLALGMMVSAASRDSQRAMAGVLCLIVLVLAGTPLADSALGEAMKKPSLVLFQLLSPAYAFGAASSWGRSSFWLGLASSHGLAWGFLGVASLLAPWTWQQKAAVTRTSMGARAYAWKFGGARRRARVRRELMSLDPVLWLVCRERGQSWALWTLAALVWGAFAVSLALRIPAEDWAAWSVIGPVVAFVLYLAAASQGSRFFVEARRSGLMELVMATPLTPAEIIKGQWRAFLRLFALPLGLLAAAQAGAALLSNRVAGGSMGPLLGGHPDFLWVVVSAGLGVVTTLMNFAALGWVGMWMGMGSKNNGMATLKTLLIVEVVPAIVFSFLTGFIMVLVMMPRMGGRFTSGSWNGLWAVLMQVGLSTALAVGKDLLLIFLARQRLHTGFRVWAMRTALVGSSLRAGAPPPVIPPPVIPSAS